MRVCLLYTLVYRHRHYVGPERLQTAGRRKFTEVFGKRTGPQSVYSAVILLVDVVFSRSSAEPPWAPTPRPGPQ